MIKQLTEMRTNADQCFTEIKQNSTDFCNEHGINPNLRTRRYLFKKRMPGEVAVDERIQDIDRAYKVEVVLPVLDIILQQLHDRFTEENVSLLREMKHFTPGSLISSDSICPDDIKNICQFYNLDAITIARERNAFAPIFTSMAHLINISDLSTSLSAPRHTDNNDQTGIEQEIHITSNEVSLQDSPSGHEVPRDIESNKRWERHSFLKPLRALEELSSFSNLSCLMKILASIAVTSCSAERTMSRIKIIKNRLRSSMLDDWFSALTVLASERDIVDCFNTKVIIDNFALTSPKLQSLLL